MEDVKKIATRESYGEAITELAREHDDIIVLDEGEMIGHGTHEELLALKGYYYNTLNAQLKENIS